MQSGMHCPHKGSKSQVPDSRCNNSSSCSICPVCSIFVYQPHYVVNIQRPFLKESHAMVGCNIISSFLVDIWKPPNDYSFNI